MGKIMLLYVLLTCFLSLSNTETATALPHIDQKTTLQHSAQTNLTTTTPLQQLTTVETAVQSTPASETTIITSAADVPTSAVGELSTAVIESETSPNVAAEEIQTTVSLTQSTANETTGTTNDKSTREVQHAMPSLAPTVTSVLTTNSSNVTYETSLSSTQTPEVKNVVTPTAKTPPTTEIPTTVKRETTHLPKTTSSTTKKPFVPTVHPTEPNKTKALKHGKTVAGVIGGTFIFMILGFLLILYKRNTIKKHQIATNEWAGPTPFLERDDGGGGDNSHVNRRSSTRISLASFLPQRLSKRMSLLGETGEEMKDMQELTMGTTFAVKDEKNALENKVEKTENLTSDGTNSENSTQTEELVLMNETKEKEEAKSKELENGQGETNEGEKEQSENTPAEPTTVEEPPMEQNDEK